MVPVGAIEGATVSLEKDGRSSKKTGRTWAGLEKTTLCFYGLVLNYLMIYLGLWLYKYVFFLATGGMG